MRLLLIEDEPKFGASLKSGLESEGYAVDWLQTGQKGLTKGIMEDYDLAIVDIGLPDISGLVVVSTLRQQERHLPVIFLTALGQIKDKVRGLDTGADDYLVKPIDLDELSARIRSLLRRPAQLENLKLSCGELILDPATRDVRRGKKSLELSLKEYALLEYMLRNVGKALSRQDLLDHVWDGNVDPLTNVIDVYVGYLRKKVDRAFPKLPALIHTIKGIGYKLTDE